MLIVLPSPTAGASIFSATGSFIEMPDGSLVNVNVAQQIKQQGSNLLMLLPTGNQVTLPFGSSAFAAGALIGTRDFLTGAFALLTIRSITPATAGGGSTVNAVLIGTGFQYDMLTGTFLGQVTVGGNPCTETFVNSNTVLINFTAPAAGTYDVVYTPNVGAAVTLTNGWVST
jgi:hypothetical protein